MAGLASQVSARCCWTVNPATATSMLRDVKDPRVCKDCQAEGRTGKPRPAPHPGPRCVTHHREVLRERRSAAHARSVQRTYGLRPGEYEALYEAQGGLCYICGPVTGRSGKTRKLCVDHDHSTLEVRGLLCRDCNSAIGLWRDDPAVWLRGAVYLTQPPAREVLSRLRRSDGLTENLDSLV